MELHRQRPDRGRDHHLLRRPRGADAEGGLRPLLQRGLCSDRGGAGGGYPAAVYGEGGAYQCLFRGRSAHCQGYVQLGRHHRRAAGLGRCGPISRSGEPLCLSAVDGGHCQRRQGGGTVSDPENGVLTGDPVFAPHYSAHRTADRQQNGGHRGGLYGQ